MLTNELNDKLTHVGPGTPMGNLMRRYWVPALLSWEVPEPDSPPVEVRLLGENLVAFRDTQGVVGLVSAYCAHRRVSLFWGRNEESGIRCVYHGWKFDVTGACVDMPSEPASSNFKDKVTIPAYPTHEAGGVVWAYMGPPELRPEPPLFEWTQVPASQRALSKVLQETNWLQALEGGIDTVHSNFLHGGRPPGMKYDTNTARGRANNFSTAPILEVVPTDYGYSYAGIRSMGDEGTNYVRAYHLVFPWTQLRATGNGRIAGHMWVPIDDYNCMVYNWHYEYEHSELNARSRSPSARPIDANPLWYRDAELMVGAGNDFGFDVDPDDGFRSIRNRTNRYMIDREVQRTENYTGIQGINTQDRAVQESMGYIADRSLERLGTTDRAIITARRLLLQAVEKVERGENPPGVAPTYYKLRAIERVLPASAHWFGEMKSDLYQLPPSTDAIDALPVGG
jgi:phenylpropionate dioxygenase-like ring-hydroxylating dioxygenase large terminal subunit